MERGLRLIALSCKTETKIVGMPGWYCSRCDEGIHTPEDMKVSDKALAEMKTRVDNLLEPSEIRRIRLQLGLTQRDAGHRIGGGVNAFQKYESGEVLPSKGLSNLLRILERHPDELEKINEPDIYEYRDNIDAISFVNADFPASMTVKFTHGRQDWGQEIHLIGSSVWFSGSRVDPSVIVA
ncbi:type II toxin-antitoxin system MqsA family antitoxin [Methylobacterium oryzihabitans]|nr:type II toxin-antitoxin system MqsA family antitoxin [Methylobacterium oryzihabitans]